MELSTFMTLAQHVLAQAVSPEVPQGITGEDLKIIAGCLSAAIVMGLGALGPGLSEGHAAGKAVEGIARNPEASSLITRTMIIGQAITESVAIYALLIAAIILFMVVL